MVRLAHLLKFEAWQTIKRPVSSNKPRRNRPKHQEQRPMIMYAKFHRLIGGLFFLVFLAFYLVMVVAISQGILPGTSQGFQLLFMAIAGTIWVIPGGIIIKLFMK